MGVGRGGEWVKSPQVSPVSGGQPPGAVRPHRVLVVLEDFHHRTRFVPLRRVMILDHHGVTSTEWGEALGVFVPSGTAGYSALGQGALPEVEAVGPILVREVSGGNAGDEVPGRSPKEALGRRHTLGPLRYCSRA